MYPKPRICIALPAITCPPFGAYVLNTLPLLPYLEAEFDVTLAFCDTPEDPQLNCHYLSILEASRSSGTKTADQKGYFNPRGPLGAWQYLQVLDKFAQEQAENFDLVIEKQWSLVGGLSSAFIRYGVPSVFIIEAEFYNNIFFKGWKDKALRFALNQLLPHLRRRWMNRANGIIVETQQTKSFLLENNYPVHNKPVTTIPNGIDPNIFFPQDRKFCREQLGISQEALVLTYVGSLRRFIQEPGPIIEALGKQKPRDVVLHMIGDGHKQQELEDIAQKFAAPVIFHGRRSQQEAALYIGAADLCLAPYNKNLFPGGKFTSASLKVCEYLACGRPVLTIPCQRMEHLLAGGKYGLFVENQVDSYREFFRNLPSREELSQMENCLISDLQSSVLRDQGIVLTWQEIAQLYKQVIMEIISHNVTPVPLKFLKV
ncbi:MAG: glycosyltransferase family 4 protein [Symploca sp. SIO1C4]|uniref:Glycosyltransferase family 4 protein n=1 Tax=Symploca sp. SIO1C4 TaxID=2607765 RepID=A0A6B3NDH2_9CYAN|nr:glycosyltransferase family 4 protein [Symploca sp. SIO1C4]